MWCLKRPVTLSVGSLTRPETADFLKRTVLRSVSRSCNHLASCNRSGSSPHYQNTEGVPAIDIALLVFGTGKRGMETSASGVPLLRNPEIRKPRSCGSSLGYSGYKLRVFQGKRQVMYQCEFQKD